jgi:hypothetical protein
MQILRYVSEQDLLLLESEHITFENFIVNSWIKPDIWHEGNCVKDIEIKITRTDKEQQ